MDIEALRDYCLSFPYVEECLPFGPENLVFKVGGKMFLLVGIDDYFRFNVKCDPDKAEELRAQYAGVEPGYHMSKKHWNTILIHSDVSAALMKEWIKDSYDLVYASLPKKVKNELENL